jgi:hypothetical protein
MIGNFALSHCGVGKQISSLTEKSEEARACNQFFVQVVQELHREFPWPHATRYGALSQVGDITIAFSSQWCYAFRYLPEAEFIQEILPPPASSSPATIQDNILAGRPFEIPFEIASDTVGRLILTNQPTAWAKYTALVMSPDLWPSDFRIMASFRLAAYIMPRLGKGDPKKLGQRSLELYEISLDRARATSAREGVPNLPMDTDMIDARG